MKKVELTIEWKTNEYYDLDNVTLLLTDDKIEAIEKSQEFLKDNPDIDSIRVKIDEDCIATTSSHGSRLGYGFVMVFRNDTLYFIGTDHYDSSHQVETNAFRL